MKIGPYTIASFAMPGQPDNSNHRFSLFPFSWELSPETAPVVYAKNAAGDQDTASFWVKVFPKKFHTSTIALDDRMMQRILNDIDPDGKIPGSTLERYLYCNRELRKQNSKQLHDLRLKTAHRFSGADRLSGRRRKRNPILPIAAPTRIRAGRWMSRSTWDSILQAPCICPSAPLTEVK